MRALPISLPILCLIGTLACGAPATEELTPPPPDIEASDEVSLEDDGGGSVDAGPTEPTEDGSALDTTTPETIEADVTSPAADTELVADAADDATEDVVADAAAEDDTAAPGDAETEPSDAGTSDMGSEEVSDGVDSVESSDVLEDVSGGDEDTSEVFDDTSGATDTAMASDGEQSDATVGEEDDAIKDVQLDGDSDADEAVEGDTSDGAQTSEACKVDDPCDDGDTCTVDDVCQLSADGEAICTGVPIEVDDLNPCTADICLDGEVFHGPLTGGDCDDGDLCTTGDTCLDGLCMGDSVTCDDGAFCNGVETCDPSVGCLAGQAPELSDGVDCTLDLCDEETDSIVHTPNASSCDNGAFCDGEEVCDVILGCAAGEPPLLSDGIDCTDDVCDEETDSVVHTPNVASCDDGVDCTVDSCDMSAGCVQSPDDAACAVDDLCVTGSCDPESGCQTAMTEGCCGNGVVEDDEQCDAAGEPPLPCPYGETHCEVCALGCELIVGALTGFCGDGVVQSADGEVCDGEADCGEDCQLLPMVALEVIDSVAYEGGEVSASVKISLDAPYAYPVIISMELSGSAVFGEDYGLSVGNESVEATLTVPAGQMAIDLFIDPIATPTMERSEWVTLSLMPTGDVVVANEANEVTIDIVEYGPSPGAVYHVAPDGDDEGPGSLEDPFATLAHGASVLQAGDTLFVHDGVYTNPGFSETHGEHGELHNDNPVLVALDVSGQDDAWIRIAAYPDGNDIKPLLRVDGEGGIQLKPGTSHVLIEGFEIEGANREILHAWAHEHRWSKEALYIGRGVFTWGPVHHIVIRECDVHHTPNSGIRFNKADYVLVEDNTVSNTTWWSSSAESGIVIATAQHVDERDVVKILYSGNTVYNNWNFMEFCSGPWEGSTEDAYGNCDHYTGGIIDGQGLYVTRNNDTYLHGRMRFENNIAFNNGFGGVVYHKTDRGELVNNMVFMNGAYPGITKYTGLTLNTATDVRIHNNIVWAREDGDYAIKNNGNASDVVATHNVVIGKTQFGSSTDNIIITPSDAPPLQDVFKNVTGITSVTPDPDAVFGPSSASEIDDVLSAFALDFEPLSTSWRFIDAAESAYAPPTDRRGVARPLGSGPDIGPFEVVADDSCSALGLETGEACDDGLLSTKDDTCHSSGACQGSTYSCQPSLCVVGASHNGVDCDFTYDPPGLICDDEDAMTVQDVCDGQGACIGVTPPDVLFHAHFEDQSLGTYRLVNVPEDFEDAGTWSNGLEDDRASVVEENGSRFLRITYPEGGVGTQAGGAQFKVPLPDAYEELYVSYRVRFKDGFDFVKGGKLPGLCGGDCNSGGNVPDGTDGFSARMMWRVGGNLMQYMYMPDQQSQWGDNLYWNVDGQRYFEPDTWHRVQTRIVMNTPGEANGVLQSWFDGELALDRDDMRLRDIEALGIDTFYFSTFFGGSGEDWAPTADEFVDFDDLVVSTAPLWFDEQTGAVDCANIDGSWSPCVDEVDCTDETCDALVGCLYIPRDAGCDDGTICTGLESCDVSAGCVGTEALDCDDDNPCTLDTCDATAGCLHDVDESPCLPCDGGSVWDEDLATCQPCEAGSYDDGSESCVPCPDDFTSGPGSTSCELVATKTRVGARDYSYLFWPTNHWHQWNNFFDVQHLQTGHYGLAFDVSKASFDHFGLIDEEVSAVDARMTDNATITDLANASVTYGVTQDGQTHVATGFLSSDGETKNPSRIIDMGHFMSRVDIPQVTYDSSTTLDGSIQLAAMPRHAVLTHRAASSEGGTMTVSITLSGEAVAQYPETTWLEGTRAVSITNASGQGWRFIIAEQSGVSAEVVREEDGSLTFSRTVEGLGVNQSLSLSVTAVPSNAGGEDQLSVWLKPQETVQVEFRQLNRDGSPAETLKEATWDEERGVFLVNLRNLSQVGAPGWQNWANLNIHNWYNRHEFVVHNETSSAVSVPIAFDGGNNAAFYIVGGSPMIRDTSGEPTGVPVQISKNWHETPFWYHLYTAMTLDPGSHTFEHTFAHAKWGEAYAAAHAQLSLVGWGQNQQWDESSLGAFGETITYDPDMTLNRAMVDDVRPFLVETGNKWGWTGNVGGASFLVYDGPGIDNRPEHQLGRLKTHYRLTGPNLTEVIYAGVTRDGKISAEITTQLGRTDDLVRAYYHLSYTFNEDVSYERLALFQMAADRYADNGFTRYAYGDADGVVFDEPITDHSSKGYISEADRGIALGGDAPWVMLYDSVHDTGNLPENLANVAFVVRDYRASIGDDLITTPHINLIKTYNGGWSQMAFELGVPYDADDTVIPAGSVIHATVEYLVPPADKAAYYGDSDYLTTMAPEVYQSTDMARTLATDNQLLVEVSVGELRRSHPVDIAGAPGATAAQFVLTGGLGYTPVRISGLARPDGWRLEKRVEEVWQRVDQGVEGNDYWQAYDDNGDFELIFNVHNRGSHSYRLVR